MLIIKNRRFWHKRKINKLKKQIYQEILNYYKSIKYFDGEYVSGMCHLLFIELYRRNINLNSHDLLPYYFSDWYKWRQWEGDTVRTLWFPLNDEGIKRRITIMQGLLLGL